MTDPTASPLLPAITAPLPLELKLLAATLVLALAQILLAARFRTRQYGALWNVGARDDAMPPLAPLPGRLLRAQANLYETLPLFAAAVLAVVLAGRVGRLSGLGCQLFFWGRLAYLPLYAAGVPVVRTLAWGVATLGLVLVLVALAFG